MAEFNIAPHDTGNAEPAARKDSSGENFPVASRLLPKRLRPHVMAYYKFVRLADDIADDPDLEPELKLSHLDALERALMKGEAHSAYLQPALDLHASLRMTGLPDTHARQVLQAFRRDAKNTPCRTWSDLMLYCRYSAAPVGRYLLALHGEGHKAVGPSDALCAALQILNHIQDCRDDWVELGRCYIPRIWFEQSKVSVERLVERSSNEPLRAILDRTLDQVDALLERAAPLPSLVKHRGLRLESAVILSLARALSRRLRRQDPLARRVRLPAPARVLATIQGIAAGLKHKMTSASAASTDDPGEITGRSGSTFFWPMLLLPKPKRTAMFAIYAFCRQVDDIVDEPGTPEGKRAALAKWREQIRSLYMGGAPSTPVAAGLADAIARYHLPRAELEAVIDGMAMDIGTPLRAPPLDTFKVYCRRVAGAVGLLAIRVFDRADAETEALALALGDALQMTNILRDLEEDAQLGRLYLPRELLVRAGIVASDPAEVLRHPSLGKACDALADMAEVRFTDAERLLAGWPRRRLWTARAMMLLYRRTLEQLRARGWRELGLRPRLPKSEKAWVTLRCLIGRPPRS